MKNVVTSETAIALMASGFPQPTPNRGQFWFHKNQDSLLCIGKETVTRGRMLTEGYFFARLGGKVEVLFIDEVRSEIVFAPTETDIPLPCEVIMTEDNGTLKIYMDFRAFDDNRADFEGESHAEVKAEAWLSK